MSAAAAWAVLARDENRPVIALLDEGLAELTRVSVDESQLCAEIARLESDAAPRWVWNATALWYPRMLAAGIRVGRARDLRAVNAILADSEYAPDSRSDPSWCIAAAAGGTASGTGSGADDGTLFELEGAPGLPEGIDEVVTELARQQRALHTSPRGRALGLLAAAESAGHLVAAEMTAAGMPWDADVHEQILADALGPAPRRPLLRAAADRVRQACADPALNVDSPGQVLRALHRVGVATTSTSRWALAEFDHPAVTALQEYKRLARLDAANGSAWLREWVRDGRFRPVYVPAGVVTGRWASAGGGALQIPRALRAAVRADPGWSLVVADVAQLEPRVLAGMAGDRALASAARGADLYGGIVAAGAAPDRAEAKVAMLGALYGATSGASGRLLPRLRRTYPDAMRLVDDAAQAGADGGVVSTLLGRSAPPPSAPWRGLQARASTVDADARVLENARRAAGDRGRFTRNFVVQGTAAEWALIWLAGIRRRLAEIPDAAVPARSGPALGSRAHLALFLHDEIIVHTPSAYADEVAEIVRESAREAGRTLFGDFPIDFPLDVHVGADAVKRGDGT